MKINFVTFRSNRRGCIQKFPDWPPGTRTVKVQLSATRCSCIPILRFAAITLCVVFQRDFVILLSTQPVRALTHSFDLAFPVMLVLINFNNIPWFSGVY